MNGPIVLGMTYDDVNKLDDFLCDCIKLYRRTYPIRWDEMREAQRILLEIRRQRKACVKVMEEAEP